MRAREPRSNSFNSTEAVSEPSSSITPSMCSSETLRRNISSRVTGFRLVECRAQQVAFCDLKQDYYSNVQNTVPLLLTENLQSEMMNCRRSNVRRAPLLIRQREDRAWGPIDAIALSLTEAFSRLEGGLVAVIVRLRNNHLKSEAKSHPQRLKSTLYLRAR